MNPYKVVTVCSSDSCNFNAWNNYFVPDRGNSTKNGRSTRSRIQNVPFSSILKPVTYFELRENFPVLMKQKQNTLKKRNGSMDSDETQKEIDSAVLLLESRNERDLIPGNNETHYEPSMKNPFGVFGRKGSSKSAQNCSGKYVQNNTTRWKSANIQIGSDSEIIFKKRNLRMLPFCEVSKVNSGNNIGIKTMTEELYKSNESSDVRPNLIISNSNTLTNFITIDDISGIKDSWTFKNTNLKSKESILDSKETFKCSLNQEKSKPYQRKQREDILREYMSVYIHWRTLNAIEEHHQLTKQAIRGVHSAKIRSATPKQRLDQFQRNVKERKGLVSKSVNSSRTISYKKTSICTIDSDSDKFNVPDSVIYLEEETDKETEKEIYFEKKEDVNCKRQEVEEDPRSDTYSEIDWLECEDIY